MGRSAAAAIDAAKIDVAKIDAFARLINHKLDEAEDAAERLHPFPYRQHQGRRQGNTDHRQRSILLAAIAGKQTGNRNACGLVHKWRARKDSSLRPSESKNLSRIAVIVSV